MAVTEQAWLDAVGVWTDDEHVGALVGAMGVSSYQQVIGAMQASLSDARSSEASAATVAVEALAQAARELATLRDEVNSGTVTSVAAKAAADAALATAQAALVSWQRETRRAVNRLGV